MRLDLIAQGNAVQVLGALAAEHEGQGFKGCELCGHTPAIAMFSPAGWRARTPISDWDFDITEEASRR